MKKYNFILIATTIMISHLTQAQDSDYKVVFDITSPDPVSQQQVVREAGLIKATHPDAQIEIVVYGQALGFIQKDISTHTSEIEKLVSQKRVSFKACHASMDRNHVEESQLIHGVSTVPDGIYEIITKQRQGWGYIKVAQ